MVEVLDLTLDDGTDDEVPQPANKRSRTSQSLRHTNEKRRTSIPEANHRRTGIHGVGASTSHQQADSSSSSEVVIVDASVARRPAAPQPTLQPIVSTAASGPREGDPPANTVTRNTGGGVQSDSDSESSLELVRESGKVATRDYAHTRPDCYEHRFQRLEAGGEGAAPANATFCSQCYCYVCDVKASECEFWGTGQRRHDHANAFPVKQWNRLREGARDAAKAHPDARRQLLLAAFEGRPAPQPAPVGPPGTEPTGAVRPAGSPAAAAVGANGMQPGSGPQTWPHGWHWRPNCNKYQYRPRQVCRDNWMRCSQCICCKCRCLASQCRSWGSGGSPTDHANLPLPGSQDPASAANPPGAQAGRQQHPPAPPPGPRASNDPLPRSSLPRSSRSNEPSSHARREVRQSSQRHSAAQTWDDLPPHPAPHLHVHLHQHHHQYQHQRHYDRNQQGQPGRRQQQDQRSNGGQLPSSRSEPIPSSGSGSGQSSQPSGTPLPPPDPPGPPQGEPPGQPVLNVFPPLPPGQPLLQSYPPLRSLQPQQPVPPPPPPPRPGQPPPPQPQLRSFPPPPPPSQQAPQMQCPQLQSFSPAPAPPQEHPELQGFPPLPAELPHGLPPQPSPPPPLPLQPLFPQPPPPLPPRGEPLPQPQLKRFSDWQPEAVVGLSCDDLEGLQEFMRDVAAVCRPSVDPPPQHTEQAEDGGVGAPAHHAHGPLPGRHVEPLDEGRPTAAAAAGAGGGLTQVGDPGCGAACAAVDPGPGSAGAASGYEALLPSVHSAPAVMSQLPDRFRRAALFGQAVAADAAAQMEDHPGDAVTAGTAAAAPAAGGPQEPLAFQVVRSERRESSMRPAAAREGSRGGTATPSGVESAAEGGRPGRDTSPGRSSVVRRLRIKNIPVVPRA